MKNYQNHLPAGLLVAYASYTAFVPVSIAHSIIIFSLALLAGYQAYLSTQKTNKYNEEVLREMRQELVSQLESVKEAHAKKISKLEDETAKLALNHIPPKVAASSPQPRKLVF